MPPTVSKESEIEPSWQDGRTEKDGKDGKDGKDCNRQICAEDGLWGDDEVNTAGRGLIG